MKKIVGSFGKFKCRIILLYSGTIFLTFLSLLQPLLFSSFIDSIVNQFKYHKVLEIIIKITILNIITIILKYNVGVYEKKLLNRITYEYIVDIVKHIQKIPYSEFKKHDPIYTAQRIAEDCSQIISFSINNFPLMIINLGQLILILNFLIRLSKSIIFMVIIFILLYVIIYFFLKAPLFNNYYSLKNSIDRFKETLIFQLTDMKFIRISSLYHSSLNVLNEKFSTMYNSSITYVKLSHLFNSIDSVITSLFSVVIMFIFGQKTYSGEISIGQFTIIQVYFSMVINVLKYFIVFFKSLQEFKVSYTRINELFIIEKEQYGKKVLNTIETLSLKNIKFWYNNLENDEQNLVFNNLSLEFSKNNIYLIKGENGSGKSTLLDIAVGLYSKEIQGGNIEYNNLELKELDIYKIRKKSIGYVGQTVYCGEETVLEYLSYYGDDKIKKICSDYNGDKNQAKLKSINDLKNSNIERYFESKFFSVKSIYNKKMSELSGGQRQKISILREILKKPDVIFLDEPNSALDKDNIVELKTILKDVKQNAIVIIVTHDTSFDEIADYCIQI